MPRNSTSRPPWSDRWTQPTLDQLLDSLKPQHHKLFNTIIRAVEGYDRVSSSIIWYGPAWKWTIHYSLVDDRGRETDSLIYLVPNRDQPLVCVPLSDGLIEHLPMKRLKKFVREGIRGGRFAVAIHWATWVLNAQSETAAVLDLLKRKHKFLTTPPSIEAKAG